MKLKETFVKAKYKATSAAVKAKDKIVDMVKENPVEIIAGAIGVAMIVIPGISIVRYVKGNRVFAKSVQELYGPNVTEGCIFGKDPKKLWGMRKNWVYRRGDIYIANLNPFRGSEQGGTRPVLVLQNNDGNYYCPTLIVAPLSSKLKKPNLPTHFLLKKGRGLMTDSIVELEQIKTIDKCRIQRYIGKIVYSGISARLRRSRCPELKKLSRKAWGCTSLSAWRHHNAGGHNDGSMC